MYAWWPDKSGRCAWDKLDALGSHALVHDYERDHHRFGSYVTGHLPRAHPLVVNETLDDRALEGVWLGNDTTTPSFWMYSFKLKKVVRMSDPQHFDHLLPFLHPDDIHHKIDLTPEEIMRMHSEDGSEESLEPDKRTSSRRLRQRPGESTLEGSKPGELEPGESVPEPGKSEKKASSQSPNLVSGETGSCTQGETKIGDLKIYKKWKKGQDVPVWAEIEFLKPQQLAQALVHYQFVFDVPEGVWTDEKSGKTAVCKFLAKREYAIKKFWYVDCEVISHPGQSDVQMSVKRGNAKSTDHAMNL